MLALAAWAAPLDRVLASLLVRSGSPRGRGRLERHADAPPVALDARRAPAHVEPAAFARGHRAAHRLVEGLEVVEGYVVGSLPEEVLGIVVEDGERLVEEYLGDHRRRDRGRLVASAKEERHEGVDHPVTKRLREAQELEDEVDGEEDGDELEAVEPLQHGAEAADLVAQLALQRLRLVVLPVVRALPKGDVELCWCHLDTKGFHHLDRVLMARRRAALHAVVDRRALVRKGARHTPAHLTGFDDVHLEAIGKAAEAPCRGHTRCAGADDAYTLAWVCRLLAGLIATHHIARRGAVLPGGLQDIADAVSKEMCRAHT